MKIGFWGREDTLLDNYMFFNTGIDPMYNNNPQYVFLYEYLKKNGHEINSIDLIKNVNELDCVIFLDFPAGKITKLAEKALTHKKKILIIVENEVVLKNNWLKKNHDLFDIILTWNDDFIDNKKYYKIQFPGIGQQQFYDFIPFLDKKNLSCMISWKKYYKHKNETQTIKKNIINYFEKNNLTDDFHLYGPNWDETVFNYSSFLGFLNYPRFRSFRKIICNDKLSSWKGYTDDKQKTLRNYKFSFIIENAISYNGFISDKIFDSFYSGTVPIYLGAANIQSLIPKECYIDFREFENINKLHDFLLNIDQKRYEKFIYNIVNFIKNKNSIFTFEYFNETILNSINSLVEK